MKSSPYKAPLNWYLHLFSMCDSCMDIGFGVRKQHTAKLISLTDYMILWDNNTIEGQIDSSGNFLC